MIKEIYDNLRTHLDSTVKDYLLFLKVGRVGGRLGEARARGWPP